MGKEEYKNNLSKLLTSDKSVWRDNLEYRNLNKYWLKKSAKIAIKLNRVLRKEGLSQKELSERIGVSPQQINKLLKGRENLTLETISKIEIALNIELVSILNEDEFVFSKTEKSVEILNEVFNKHLKVQVEYLIEKQIKNFLLKEVGLVERVNLNEARKYKEVHYTVNTKRNKEDFNYAMAA